jgi:DNA-binding transcriptional LysR family regulator
VELRHLRYFVAVAEMENLSRAAAQRPHVAQPSLSRQIRDLEKAVGVPLLEIFGARVEAAGTRRTGGRVACYASIAFAEPRRFAERVTYETASNPINATGIKNKAPSPAR